MEISLEKYAILRRRLHANPELSGLEEQTALLIKEALLEIGITKIETGLGSNGVLGIVEGNKKGPSLLIRSELDALPIQEINDFDHKSTIDGVSHKCGHDGHMAICLAVAEYCHLNRENLGKVYFLFQPAEETGEGAKGAYLELSKRKIEFDEVIALHNVPGFPLGQIILKDGTFTPAVHTLKIKLTGKTAHAAEPENGVNPSELFPTIIKSAKEICISDVNDKNFTLMTPVYFQLGQKSFGVAAGEAELYYTMRSWDKEVLDNATNKLKKVVSSHSEKEGVQATFEILEVFENNYNDNTTNEKIRQAAKLSDLSTHEIQQPFKWGEDFGVFTRRVKGAMFGLGAGEQQPALHNPDYDFPDELIEKGFLVLRNYIKLNYSDG